MGLGSTLSNALAGMNASQRGIDVLSRNVANAGTPGYHRQALVVTETSYGTSAQVRTAGLQRAFNEAMQKQHIIAVSSSGYHSVRANFLDRLQMHIGKPGDANALDKLYGGFENAMQALSTNPNDLTARAGVINAAQSLVEQLNTLSGAVQEMRREAEYQISNGVSELNRQLTALADINIRVLDLSQDQTARLALMDERDRLVTSIAEKIDVRATYRADGTVALMTETGIGILDVQPSEFKFQTGGALTGTSLFDSDPGQNGVGRLTLRTPSGLEIDLAAQNLLSSGSLAGLLELRDNTLVNMQNQLDDIAAGLAQAFNTVTTRVDADAGALQFDISAMQPGNSMLLSYSEGGVNQSVRVVRVDDPSSLPLTSPNAKGERVVGVDFNGDIAAQINTALPQLNFSLVGTDLTVADGTAGITSLVASTTVDGNQEGVGALNLFVDTRGEVFTNSIDGVGQKLGFAGRIQINLDVIADPSLLVKYDAGVSMGDPTRPQFLLESLKSMEFVSDRMTDVADGGVRLAGTVRDIISQMINHQGNVVAKGQSLSGTASFALESVNTRMASEYGVNVDEEMARLMQLQNAYSASARVVSTVQELIDALLRM